MSSVMFFLGTVRVGSVCKELVSLYVQMCKYFFLATCNLLNKLILSGSLQIVNFKKDIRFFCLFLVCLENKIKVLFQLLLADETVSLDVGKLIQQARMEKKLTQKDLATVRLSSCSLFIQYC